MALKCCNETAVEALLVALAPFDHEFTLKVKKVKKTGTMILR
eukprot:CAMPEP_0119129570 /NCGR_PEP_ID=MMETSP1310-20130426/7262_1 /TAXON_ID=464262 /ORGANISM="Genus nov. species nov., Strain RCC2339" /LENGTH=41 /DNA_ID= /DNA_START= /DNA_END= /DNA_ORIENTATION=